MPGGIDGIDGDNKHHKPVKQNLQIVYWHTVPQRMNEWMNGEGWTDKQTNKRTNERTSEMKTLKVIE